VTRVRLRFFDPDGTELDDVIIWQSGNFSGIPGRAVTVEVTTLEDDDEVITRRLEAFDQRSLRFR